MATKSIGILGGMGPQASCELYRLINSISVENYRAERNSDFPHLLINNLPVPDLISSTGSADQTIHAVRLGAVNLLNAGVTDLFMACNTMHAFADELFTGLNCNFHSMVDIVIDKVKQLGNPKIFIFGTKTTLETGIYQNAAQKVEIDFSTPSEELLKQTVALILSTIGGEEKTRDKAKYLDLMMKEAKAANTKNILLACTELPLVIQNTLPDYNLISTLQVMAERICALHFTNMNKQ
jgi:aspartate racemase